MNNDDIQTLTDRQLEQMVIDLQNRRKGIVQDIQIANEKRDEINRKIEKLVAESGKRNYAELVLNFKLTHDHVALLNESNNDSDIGELTDLQISEIIDMQVDDDGLTENQEKHIAKLLSELPYAQKYINSKADRLVKQKEITD